MMFWKKSNAWTTGVVASVAVIALVAAAATATAAVLKQRVAGSLVATADDSDVRGKFRIRVQTRNAGARERLEVYAKGLAAERDDDGNRPAYDVFLLDDSGGEFDFGTARINRHGQARLVFASNQSDYPEGVESLTEFGEGTIELRDADDNVLADGEIPAFVGLDDDNEEGSRTGARIKDKSRLSPTSDDSKARARMTARFANKPQGERSSLVLVAKRLERGEYDVVVLTDDDTEIDLGSFRAVTRAGVGVLVLDTDDGDEIPGDDGLFSLSKLDVEVRDADGTVVLSGRFPNMDLGSSDASDDSSSN